MRIIFNLYNTGLGNNGGTRTVIKCGEILADLGHEVIMYTNVSSRYTWGNIKKVKILVDDKPPKCDIVIATGYHSVENTLRTNADKKYYYIRAYEQWNANEYKLLESYRKLNCIVNSSWLYKYLKKNNIQSEIIHQGLDFNIFYIKKNITKKDRMGAIYSERHKTKRHVDAISVSKMIKCQLKMLNKDLKNPSEEELNIWYNKIKVWFAPTELEGLHNPPMEACLAGCALVCTDHNRSGMSDYAIHNKTALVYPARDLKAAGSFVRQLLDDNDLRLRLNKNMVERLVVKIGSRKENMKKLIEYIKG